MNQIAVIPIHELTASIRAEIRAEIRAIKQQPQRDPNEVLDVKGVAKEIKMGTSKARQLLKEGQIKCRKVGTNYRTTRAAVLEYITENFEDKDFKDILNRRK